MFGSMSASALGKAKHTHCGMADASQGGVTSGLVSGTLVATAMGWRPCEAIAEGDKVLTFDAGLRTVTKVTRTRLWSETEPCPKHFWPLEVPPGAMGNRTVMHILPGQNIMVESDTAEDIYGDPFSLIPAVAMEGLRGVHRAPPDEYLEIICLHFEEEQVIFAKTGTLFFCPSSRDILDCVFDNGYDPLYTVLPIEEARFIASRMEEEVVTQDRDVMPEFAGAVFA